ncbi:MAG: hypothetical protein QXT26_01995 [Thermoproteota archaeon]
MGKSTDHLDRILTLIVRSRLDEAEKQMESFKPNDDYEAGYLKGLRGIVYSLRKPIEESIVESEDPTAHLKSIRESISVHYLSKEEEGYFMAWMDFLRKLSSSKKSIVKKEPSEQPG